MQSIDLKGQEKEIGLYDLLCQWDSSQAVSMASIHSSTADGTNTATNDPQYDAVSIVHPLAARHS
jgi:hypothetical protein